MQVAAGRSGRVQVAAGRSGRVVEYAAAPLWACPRAVALGPPARALYKDNPAFSKGPFCPCLSGVRVLFWYPFGGRTELAYAEAVDVGGMMGLSSIPFLYLSR